ncbi:MAG: nuclear transport factor 2 family protein [bacterium]
MKKVVLFILVLVSGATMVCQTAPKVDLAVEKQEVRAVMEKINAAWEAEDMEAFSRHVIHDEGMVNFGTDVAERWVGWEALKEGLQRQFEAFSDTKVTPHHIDIHVSGTGTTAWLAQAMTVSTKFLDKPVELEARITGVFEKRGPDWLMVQFHYSVPISESRRLGM